jgi:hypothetical protein
MAPWAAAYVSVAVPQAPVRVSRELKFTLSVRSVTFVEKMARV